MINTMRTKEHQKRVEDLVMRANDKPSNVSWESHYMELGKAYYRSKAMAFVVGNNSEGKLYKKDIAEFIDYITR